MGRRGLLLPDRYVVGLTAVDPRALWGRGKRALLLDRDNTVVPRDTGRVPPDVESWLAEARAVGFSLCLVTNNWASNVRPDAERVGALLVPRAAKPLPFAVLRACRLLGVRRDQAVLFGDQVFTDVLAGRLAGVETVLVKPQAKADLAHTLLLRRLEARVLRGMAPEPGDAR